jgi:hypothetical protein
VPLAVVPLAAMPLVAHAAVGGGGVPVEAAGHPLTPWLALASVAMVATLFAAHRLVMRGPRGGARR